MCSDHPKTFQLRGVFALLCQAWQGLVECGDPLSSSGNFCENQIRANPLKNKGNGQPLSEEDTRRTHLYKMEPGCG